MAAGDQRFACSICGDDTWSFKKLRKIGPNQWACPYDYRGLHDADLQGAGTPQIIIQPKARKIVRETVEVPLLAKSEAAIFNLLSASYGGGVPPYPYVDVTNGDGAVVGTQGVRPAAWSAIYLAEVIRENRRPATWIDLAKVRLRTLCDYLLTQQSGSPFIDATITACIGPTASTELDYGGFLTMQDPCVFELAYIYAEDQGAGGLALLRAYQILGDIKYQAGYRDALTCLRRMQCGGKLTTRYAVTTSGGTTRYDSGAWTHKMVVYDPIGACGGGSDGAFISGNAMVTLATSGDGTTNSTVEGFIPTIWRGDIYFPALPGTEFRLRMQMYVSSTSATLTATNYLGGTFNAADGTLIDTFTTNSTGAKSFTGTWTAQPATLSRLKAYWKVSSGTSTWKSLVYGIELR